MTYQTIIYAEDGPVGTITLNRPDDGNMFTADMCLEIRDCIEAVRRAPRIPKTRLQWRKADLAIGQAGDGEEPSGFPTVDPAFGMPAWWIQPSERDQVEQAGLAGDQQGIAAGPARGRDDPVKTPFAGGVVFAGQQALAEDVEPI